MSELTFFEFIRRYNSLYKANNEIYHRLARHFGLSDTAFWILYTLREQGGCVSQSQLCGELFLSKQTIHSLSAEPTKNCWRRAAFFNWRTCQTTGKTSWCGSHLRESSFSAK